MKRIAILVLVLCVCAMTSACGASSTDDNEKTDEIAVENINYLDYTYKEVSAEAFMKEVAANPLRAEADYLGNYITFSGYVSETMSGKHSISESGSSVEIVYKTYGTTDATLDDVFILYERIEFGEGFMCTLHPSLPKESLSRERMTVWGKVTELPSDGHDYCSVEVLHYEFEKAPEQDGITYTEYTANDLIDEYLNDPQKAKSDLYNTFVSITAPVHEIKTNGFKCGKSSDGGYSFSYGWIEFPFTNDAQKNVLIEKNIGDSVTVKGRIAEIYGDISHAYYAIELFDVQ